MSSGTMGSEPLLLRTWETKGFARRLRRNGELTKTNEQQLMCFGKKHHVVHVIYFFEAWWRISQKMLSHNNDEEFLPSTTQKDNMEDRCESIWPPLHHWDVRAFSSEVVMSRWAFYKNTDSVLIYRFDLTPPLFYFI